MLEVESLALLPREFLQGVFVAVACGAAIGLERQLRGKPAGMRTCVLICLGTHAFVSLGSQFQGPSADPTRVLGQVVTGIGFLGAGVIVTRAGSVAGVTTAAVIWMLAAIGATTGTGHHPRAAALTLLAIAVLVGIDWLERAFKWLRRGIYSGNDES